MKFFNKKNNKFVNGFTLVESLIAVSIFSVSIIAMMSVLGGGIANTNYVKNKLVATYLAQEGVEYVRNLRDKHLLYDPAGEGWINFSQKVKEFPPSTIPGFDRQITILDSFPDYSATITSTVSWKQGIRDYSVTLTTELFNWIE